MLKVNGQVVKTPVSVLEAREIVTITADEIAELERLQVKSRQDWPLVFSANCRGDVWAYFTRGYSPEDQREERRGVSRILDRVVKKYRRIRPGLGRFFIDQTGVFYKVEEKTPVQFILFQR